MADGPAKTLKAGHSKQDDHPSWAVKRTYLNLLHVARRSSRVYPAMCV
jgi:hypothetical protein